MASEGERLNIQIPAEDVARQAVDAIRGYAYQLYSTAIDWTRLAPQGKLLVEVADDYAVLAGEALKLVPVKDNAASGSLTLRAKGVADALNSFWRCKRSNPELDVKLNYLTTANPGFEVGVTFPGDIPGIEYWREAAREGVSVEPLRQFLLNLALEADFVDWLRAADEHAVRRELLRQIRWEYGAPPLKELDALLAEGLLLASPQLGLAPSDALRAVPAVLHHLLRLASTKGERVATAAELAAIVEAATSVSLSMTALRRLVAGAAPNQALVQARGVLTAVADVPALSGSVPRHERCEAIWAPLRVGVVPWIVGSSGLGKTSLALETARSSNREWWVLPLRGLEPLEITARLRVARGIAAEANFGGIILDDLPGQMNGQALLELACLSRATDRADGGLIITSYDQPSATARQSVIKGVQCLDAPYFDETEIAALITANGGDASKWAASTYHFCSQGHPQLVSARILGLKLRGWPDSERLGGAPLHPSPDAEHERRLTRKRLIDELPSPTRQLLYRLSLVTAGFDRAMAMRIGGSAPPLAAPGDALDNLIGPWIERRSATEMRVSPLVTDAGVMSLAPEEIKAVHAAICSDLSGRRPFPAEQLPQLLISGLAAQDETALSIVSMAPLAAPADTWPSIAHALYVMRYFRPDTAIFDGNTRLNAMLRLAQLRVILATGNDHTAKSVYERLIVESDGIEGSGDIQIAAAFSLLSQPASPLTPREWLPIVRSLESHKLEESFGGPTDENGVPNWHPADAMFVWRATQLQSAEHLKDLFATLDAASDDTRQRYLGALVEPYAGRRAVIQTAWVHASMEPNFDARKAIADLDEIAEVVARWKDDDFELEVVCSRAILLAEYCDDCEGALAVLDVAAAKRPNDGRIARERTKIEFRMGKHQQVLDTLDQQLSQIPNSDKIDRTSAYRQAAVSAARLGEFEQAAELFAKAIETASASLGGMRDTVIGLNADRAVVLFEANQRKDALRSLRLAVEQLDHTDVTTRRGEFLLCALAAVATFMVARLSGEDDRTCVQIAGFCSGSPPDEPWPGPKPPPPVLWYQLAAIERKLSVDQGIATETKRRTAGAHIEPFEVIRVRDELVDAVALDDAVELAARLNEFCRTEQYVAAGPMSEIASITTVLPEPPWTNIAIDLSSPTIRNEIVAALSAFTAHRLLKTGGDARSDLRSALGGSAEFSPLLSDLDGFDAPFAPPPEEMAAFAAVKRDEPLDPETLFAASFCLWRWLRLNRKFESVLAPPLAARLAHHWRHAVEQTPFRLRTPLRTGPPILEASMRANDLSSLAALVLAAHEAVSNLLTADAVAALKAAAGTSLAA